MRKTDIEWIIKLLGAIGLFAWGFCTLDRSVGDKLEAQGVPPSSAIVASEWTNGSYSKIGKRQSFWRVNPGVLLSCCHPDSG